METAIISIICIGLVVFGGMTMSRGFITSVDASTTSLEEVGQRNEIILRTELSPVSTAMPAADTLEVVLENTGQVRLAEFDKWDFIVNYRDAEGANHVAWLPYAAVPAANEWNVSWIHLGGAPEVFEPNVLNPGEQIMLKVVLDPAPGPGTTNMVVVATPNGVTASTYFSP
jgi:hypothetical protein